jgi:hypothetical protein
VWGAAQKRGAEALGARGYSGVSEGKGRGTEARRGSLGRISAAGVTETRLCAAASEAIGLCAAAPIKGRSRSLAASETREPRSAPRLWPKARANGQEQARPVFTAVFQPPTRPPQTPLRPQPARHRPHFAPNPPATDPTSPPTRPIMLLAAYLAPQCSCRKSC